MTLSIVQLFEPFQLPNAAAVFYTMPTAAGTVLKNGRVRLSNTSALPVEATLYAAPSGNASGVANEFFPGMSIAANSYVDVDLPTLQTGDTLRGFAATAAVITVFEMGGALYSP